CEAESTESIDLIELQDQILQRMDAQLVFHGRSKLSYEVVMKKRNDDTQRLKRKIVRIKKENPTIFEPGSSDLEFLSEKQLKSYFEIFLAGYDYIFAQIFYANLLKFKAQKEYPDDECEQAAYIKFMIARFQNFIEALQDYQREYNCLPIFFTATVAQASKRSDFGSDLFSLWITFDKASIELFKFHRYRKEIENLPVSFLPPFHKKDGEDESGAAAGGGGSSHG
ncbi:hypothetical protein EBR77_04270, partial [bacterium]|nr:hypothetical protein [bacterium]